MFFWFSKKDFSALKEPSDGGADGVSHRGLGQKCEH